jgi:hypothetical protein
MNLNHTLDHRLHFFPLEQALGQGACALATPGKMPRSWG